MLKDPRHKITYQHKTAEKHHEENKPVKVFLFHKNSYPAAELKPGNAFRR